MSFYTVDQLYALNDCQNQGSFLTWVPFESTYMFRVSADFLDLDLDYHASYVYDL